MTVVVVVVVCEGTGSLNVYLKYSTTTYTLFNQTGQHGDVWLAAKLDIHTQAPYSLVFEGVKGANYTSDIAIDDISLSPGTCAQLPTGTPPVTTPQPLRTSSLVLWCCRWWCSSCCCCCRWWWCCCCCWWWCPDMTFAV